jgi:hypothetical protein
MTVWLIALIFFIVIITLFIIFMFISVGFVQGEMNYDVCNNMKHAIMLNEKIYFDKEYSRCTASNLFKLCLLTDYLTCSSFTDDNFILPSGFTMWEKINIDGKTRGTIIWNPRRGKAIIVFGSRTTLSDWRFNPITQVAPEHLLYYKDGILVEKDMYNIYLEMRTYIQDWLFNNKGCIKDIIVTGFGVGGALSNLCALDIPLNCYNVGNYTFGSPRIGNDKFAKYYNETFRNKPTYRVVNTEDIMPESIPSLVGGLKYEHLQIPIVFTTNLGSIEMNHVDAYYNHMPR